MVLTAAKREHLAKVPRAAKILFVAKITDTSVFGHEITADLFGPVRRSIICDDQLKILIGLCQQ
jgi:hypothetical protein